MFSNEIEAILKNFSRFIGVFSLDRIPKLSNHQSAVINLAPSTAQWGHWCGLSKNPIQSNKYSEDTLYHSLHVYEYFDSLGGSEEKVKHLCSNLSLEPDAVVLYNETRLQADNMITCAAYAMTYIIHRLENHDLCFSDLLDEIFSGNPIKDEEMVVSFVEKIQSH